MSLMLCFSSLVSLSVWRRRVFIDVMWSSADYHLSTPPFSYIHSLIFRVGFLSTVFIHSFRLNIFAFGLPFFFNCSFVRVLCGIRFDFVSIRYDRLNRLKSNRGMNTWWSLRWPSKLRTMLKFIRASMIASLRMSTKSANLKAYPNYYYYHALYVCMPLYGRTNISIVFQRKSNESKLSLTTARGWTKSSPNVTRRTQYVDCTCAERDLRHTTSVFLIC